jgi:hypothetical protein
MYYLAERPHQDLENTRICGGPIVGEGRGKARERLGGILKYCYREAA